MTIFVYDHTFDGLLTILYESFLFQQKPDQIIPVKRYTGELFGTVYHINSSSEKADTVWKEIKNRTSTAQADQFYYAFLSDEENIEIAVFNVLADVLDMGINSSARLRSDKKMITRMAGKVEAEVKNAIRLTKWHQTTEHILFNSIAPHYNILSVVANYFHKNSPDQRWILYDRSRDFGYYFNFKQLSGIYLNSEVLDNKTNEIAQRAIGKERGQIAQFLMRQKMGKSKNKSMMNLDFQIVSSRFWSLMPENVFN